MDVDALAAGLESGERRALARAITLVESERADHRVSALALLDRVRRPRPVSLRIGMTGVPGAGKSTLIEVLGRRLIERGHRLAVLTVDPSSAISGGSILGDKTRMNELARDPRAFIRPSPLGAAAGGVARRTPEVVDLCEAAGYDRVLVETVGVGQSEIAVAEMVDLFVLLLLPAGGDELQGIKRGIMELADLVVVNKADGNLAGPARHTAADYGNALRLMRPRAAGWTVPVRVCSALEDRGIDGVLESMDAFARFMNEGDRLGKRRAAQARALLWREVGDELLAVFGARPEVRSLLPGIESDVASGALSPSVGAARLVRAFLARVGAKPESPPDEVST